MFFCNPDKTCQNSLTISCSLKSKDSIPINFSGYIYIKRDALAQLDNLAFLKEIVQYYQSQLGCLRKSMS